MKLNLKVVSVLTGLLLPGIVVVMVIFVDNRTMTQTPSTATTEVIGGGRLVIVGYRPKPGKADALMALMKTHMPRLLAQGLVTSRESVIMRAKDGTVIEVFEWKSKEAIDSAHTNPAVQTMWKEYAEVCDFVPIASIDEATKLFSDFTPIVFDENKH